MELSLDLAPLDDGGVRAWRDLSSGDFTVAVLGTECRVRAWSWGARRRLLEAAVAGGRVDEARFVEGLCELTCDPVPPVELRPVFACVVLALFGVRGGERPPPIVEAERELMREFGWTPRVLDEQPAPSLDALVGSVEVEPAQPPSGWTRIVVDE